ncbi:MAG: HesA/MoeB/ThiF family protein [Polyangiaceae bacterium]|nr:HesA/MoeB/ThiF family protein [Polyangiaceae bacterium]
MADRLPSIPNRYSRQTLFSGIGTDGQASIITSKVAVVGCGGLGSVQASLLARAGVGRIRLIDHDSVDETNLQRQILYDERAARDAVPKAIAAQASLRRVNSLVDIDAVVEDINPCTIERLLGGYDLIMDATDNFATRYLINEYAVKCGIPWIYGACVGSHGMVCPMLPRDTACLACLFETEPDPRVSPRCDAVGVIGPIVTVIAGMQVAEALKILSGRRQQVCRKLTVVDLWENRFDSIEVLPDPECPCCAKFQFHRLDGSRNAE